MYINIIYPNNLRKYNLDELKFVIYLYECILNSLFILKLNRVMIVPIFKL